VKEKANDKASGKNESVSATTKNDVAKEPAHTTEKVASDLQNRRESASPYKDHIKEILVKQTVRLLIAG